jgi:hypothetical protein
MAERYAAQVVEAAVKKRWPNNPAPRPCGLAIVALGYEDTNGCNIMDITFAESAFLERHGFGLDEILDGRGLSKLTRERKAKEADFVLILTSVRCRAARHRIRTRAGHCAQCKPSSIGFTKRERSTGMSTLLDRPPEN